MREQLILIYSYLHGIWRYRWSALAICWVVVLVGWVVVYSLPNQYTSKAVMQIDTQSVMTPLLQGLAVDPEVEAGIGIMTQFLLSRKNLEEVIRQTDLGLEAGDARSMDSLVAELASSIVLKEGGRRDGDIYELSYQGASPELVYQVVSKLLNTLIETMLSAGRTDTAAAQVFLDRQITEYETRLTIAEQKLAEFKRANVGFMPDEGGGYYRRLQREQSELDDIRSELRLAKRRGSELLKQLGGESLLLESYDTAKVLKLRQYREQLEVLLSQYTENHPDVQALRASIADVMASDSVDDGLVGVGVGDSVEFNPVYQELKADSHRASIEVETLKIRLEEKKNSVDELRQAVGIIPDVEAKLAKLNRDYEITRERYLDLVARRESARLAQEVGLSGSNINFRMIDSPRVAMKPSGPSRRLLLSVVLLAGVFAGFGWGFFRYLLQPTFIDLSQVREKVGLPILGSVGLYLTAQHKKKRRIQLFSFALFFSLLLISYAGVLVFSASSSELVNALISSRSLAI
ncbi:MAG: hypothetical protein GXP11_06305 [Gammaproteobacteria bacterium]|nr:hypothetical protein [Gammaproteobacteria bacterium]